MPIKAKDPVGRRHDDVEIMRNKQNAAIKSVTDIFDKLVKSYFTVVIYTLNRLVKHKEFRSP